MKKLFRLLLPLAALLLLAAGCEKEDAQAAESLSTPDVETVKLEAPFAETPLALTSAGQSADVKMLESLIKKAGMEYAIDVVMTPDNLGEAKTLIIAIGGSSKGLGAAGIDAEDEIVRVENLIGAAREKGMDIIGMHIGGEGRRGELSDKFIEAAAGKMDYLVVVKGGNDDGLFSRTSSEKNIPLEEVDSIITSLDALKKAFPAN